MELGTRIREHRDALGLNQDELAEKMFVSRQTISNWENDKTYPDVQSLLLLSNLFGVSLDQLVKGDIVLMKEIVNEQEIKKLDHYGKILTAHFAIMIIMIISAVPLAEWIGFYALIPFCLIWVVTMYWALKVEKIKKENDIQTYKEIVAFSNGQKLDEINKQREIGKRPYQKIMFALASAVIAALICIVTGLIVS